MHKSLLSQEPAAWAVPVAAVLVGAKQRIDLVRLEALEAVRLSA